jgi:hypothetical protein
MKLHFFPIKNAIHSISALSQGNQTLGTACVRYRGYKACIIQTPELSGKKDLKASDCGFSFRLESHRKITKRRNSEQKIANEI